MYMQKKIYVAPNFEVYNMEPESMVAYTTREEVGDGEIDYGGGSGGTDMGTNKKQYGFSSAPWE